jgi:hypothetical protein
MFTLLSLYQIVSLMLPTIFVNMTNDYLIQKHYACLMVIFSKINMR